MDYKESVKPKKASAHNSANGNGKGNGKMLRVSEVALMVDAHPNSVRYWADIGLLPTIRIGLRGDRRFKKEDVNVFLESFGRGSNDEVSETFQSNGHDPEVSMRHKG